jgi:hypothetical protein
MASTLDRLAAGGVLSDDERAAIAADPATTQFGWLLRSAELAGHDVDQVMRDALGERSLSGARSVAQVTHARIAEALRVWSARAEYSTPNQDQERCTCSVIRAT